VKSTLQSDKHLAEVPASYDCFLVSTFGLAAFRQFVISFLVSVTFS